jgi:DNA-binding transcriptional MerR regulator
VTTHLSIGEFSQRTRLSQKALRIYGELGLVVPAFVDPGSGYRFYSEEQVESARLVGLLRRLEMPLAAIGELLALDGPEAAQALTDWWDGVEAMRVERRELLTYLQGRMRGEEPTVYDVNVRSMPERTLVSINRHVDASEAEAFFDEAFSRLRACGPGLEGIGGVPFVVFYGEVSADSDGPIELCRAVAGAASAAEPNGGIQRRVEAAHDEAFIRLALKEMGWPALLPACDALERWTKENGREPAGAPRQLLIADQRTATPETLVCDLSVPLRVNAAPAVSQATRR